MEKEILEKKQREKIIDSVLNSIESALEHEGDVEEIGEILLEEKEPSDEQAASALGEKPPEPSSAAVRWFFVSIAAVMLFFSVIGVIYSVGFVRDRVVDIRDRHALREEFAAFVYPVVINDPPAFGSVNNLQPTTIISCAIWKIILFGDKSNYSPDAGVIYVPAADVERSASSIFGTGSLNHQSVSSLGIDFIYSAQSNNYQVPENPPLFANSPLVTDVTNIGESYTVTVDYMAPSPLAIAGIEHEIEPTKTMIYNISRTRDRMTINSIQVVAFVPV
jgi:hypothetical protein